MSATRVLAVDRDEPDPAALDEAAAVLRAGGLVAFATETVYGLGADATNPEAVARIFEAKGRPSRNPLIVHASEGAMARRCVAEWPAEAELLRRHFWPGPLTLVLPRSEIIPDLVTAGRATVGVRVPAPLVARELILRTGRPIAAPSANRSTGISPTLASHVVKDLDGRIDLILDSGQTSVGLESTVLDLTTRRPRILRPGPITREQLERVLGVLHIHEAPDAAPSSGPDAPLPSPGLLPVHYAPRTPTYRVESADELDRFPWPSRGRAAFVVLGPDEPIAVPVPLDWQFDLKTPEQAAQDLYVVLHQCDEAGLEAIVVRLPPHHPDWHAVRDRLWRATQPPRLLP